MPRAKKRADGRYQKSVTVGLKDGKPIRKVIYGRTQKDLDAAYVALKAEMGKGADLTADTTVAELMDDYMRSEKSGLKRRAKESVMYAGAAACRHVGSIQVRDLNVDDVERMKRAMAETPVMFNRALLYLKGALRYGQKHGLVGRNVAELVPPIRHKSKEKRALSPAEVEAVKAATLTPKERALIDILYYTGVRIGECLALTKADADLKGGRLRVNKSLEGETKTSAGVRNIPIAPPLAASLKTYLPTLTGDDALLFPNQKGGKLTVGNTYRRWDRLRAKVFGPYAAEDITPHLFRHNYASDLYKAGVDLKSAQYLLGHTDVKTTLGIYTHFGEGDIDPAKLFDYYAKV